MEEFSGKTAVITGAAAGIGRGLAERDDFLSQYLGLKLDTFGVFVRRDALHKLRLLEPVLFDLRDGRRIERGLRQTRSR